MSGGGCIFLDLEQSLGVHKTLEPLKNRVSLGPHMNSHVHGVPYRQPLLDVK